MKQIIVLAGLILLGIVIVGLINGTLQTAVTQLFSRVVAEINGIAP